MTENAVDSPDAAEAEVDQTPVENHPCDGCGKLDDHPMVHIWAPWSKKIDEKTTVVVEDPSFHHDCLPQEYRDMVAEGPQHAVIRAAIEAAENGVHGDELRAYIQSLPSDNNIEPEEA